MPHLQIEIHVLHPSPSAESKAKGYLLPDFYSGATGLPGRCSEGLLLRRLESAQFSRRATFAFPDCRSFDADIIPEPAR
jgi:hypothetical protein